MTKISEIACRKCGAKLIEGATLKRANPKGELPAIWECMDACGVPYISEQAKIVRAIKGDEE